MLIFFFFFSSSSLRSSPHSGHQIKVKDRKITRIFNVDLNLEYEKYSMKYIFILNIGTH